MSLLMDALRKAEADKKQGTSIESGKLVLTSDPAPAPPATTHDSDEDIEASLAATVDLRRATRENPTPPPSAELTLEPLAYPDLLDNDFESTAEPPAAEPAAATNQTSTQPSLRGVREPRNDSVDDVQAHRGDGAGAADPLDALMAEPEPSRESGITETVASAATVFEAGTSGPSRRVIVWGAVGAAAIAALLIGAGFYYFHQAPVTLTLPSPSVAANVEKPLPRELPVLPVTGALASAPAIHNEPLVRIEPQNAAPSAPADAAPRADDPEPTSTSPIAPPTTPEPQAIAVTAEPASEPPVPEPRFANPTPAIVPATAGLSLGQLRIARSAPGATIEPLLNDAYDAYIRGDYAAAASAYATVLERQPERRDALLGMAALKLRDGDIAAAHRMYREVLQRDPGNATAQAALFSIESGAADDISEAKLKLLLDEGVDGGYIYFSLGNLYARRQRWPDAQQAYFEALRYHPANPDYNYNLAVSLDRIGQRDAAIRYYEAAIDLTDSERAGFDPALALARLRALADAGAE
jgi:tetratricopeptide (TPR) repeat protein